MLDKISSRLEDSEECISYLENNVVEIIQWKQQNLFEEIMAENFSNWAKYINLQIKLECIPKRIIPKSTLNHVTVKFLKTKEKKNTEGKERKVILHLQRISNLNIRGFLSRNHGDQKEVALYFSNVERNINLEYYIQWTWLSEKGEIKTYLDYGKKKFLNCHQYTLSKRMDKGNSLSRGNIFFFKKGNFE